MEIIITAALSGFVGALAGGAVSLLSQILNRRWQKQDLIFKTKKELYSKIAGIGSRYIGNDPFTEINANAAQILLLCGDELEGNLKAYIAEIETINREVKNKTIEEANKIINGTSLSVAAKALDVIDSMRKELGINSKNGWF